ncbi:hypothetical protein CRE_07677 [Caenorhabditis remanei]|uniref:Arrestin C-terminal-like domain-containing protein n=1 Tax=Caenorhabditis remanei TaxID=31234 RepID=E3MZV1_CAERE|nr:hypothetical protein CRE_07677 [Caenorhabditis remanei]
MSLSLPIITFDQTDKPYYPGDNVTGVITINNENPLEARSIVVSWRGKSKVSGVNLFELPCVKYMFNKTQVTWVAKEAQNKIPAGNHKIKFSINLPKDCLPTFHGLLGKVDYKVKVVIDRPRKFDLKAEGEFQVTRKLELPMRMGINDWFFKTDLRSGLIFSNGPVTMKVTLNSLVFLPGQTIDLTFHVANNSSEEIRRIFAKFYKRTHYHARVQQSPCKEFYNHTCPLSCFQQANVRDKVRNAEKMKISLGPYSEQTYSMPFTFPDNETTPSFHSGLITHGYFMEFGFRSKNSVDKAMMCTLYMGEMGDEMLLGADKISEEKKPAVGAPPAYEE